MALFEFGRGGRGRVTNGTLSDARVYVTKSGRTHLDIAFRVSSAVMKKKGWLDGDRFVADFDDESNTWKLKRVTGPNMGNKLSASGRKDGKSATVRFAVKAEWLKNIGLQQGEGYDCTLEPSDGEVAVFKVIRTA